jgi:hypothetical protein
MDMLERIYGSVEYRWRVQQAKSYGVFWILVSVIILFVMLGRGVNGGMGAALLVAGILSVAFGIVFLILACITLGQNKKVLNHYEQYEVYSVLLDAPVVSRAYKRFSYFILRFDGKNGQIICNTSPIWGHTDADLFPLADYRDEYVDILYDPKGNKAYILGLTEVEEEEDEEEETEE